MVITFVTKKLEGVLATDKRRIREFGSDDAKSIYRRMAQLHAAPDLEAMRSLPGRCHELREDRAGQLAIDINKHLRMVFRPSVDPPPAKVDGGLDWSAVTEITILEVTDYHGS